MLILLLLRFLWKPSPSLPLSKKRQTNSATYQEQSSRKRYLLQQFLYMYDSEDLCLFFVCLLLLAADGNPKWVHSTSTSVRRDLLVLFASSLALLSVALLATLMKVSRKIRPRGSGGYRTDRGRNQVWQEDRVSDRPTSPSLRSQLAHQTCDEGGGGGVLQQLLMNPWYRKRLDMVPTQSSDMVLSFFFYRPQQLLFFPDRVEQARKETI
jgi:hypothetical protein